MFETYRQFEILIPAKGRKGAAHCGEELTGFIMRPAVKTGLNNKMRKNEQDDNSTQLDILIYDSAKYPIFQRFGDSVIVPPEGVVGIISVKKKLKDTDIEHEAIRGPFLALVAMESFEKLPSILFDLSRRLVWIFHSR